MKIFKLLALLVLLTTACSKVENETDGEKIASQITALVKEKNITKVSICRNNYFTENDKTFTIEGEFIIVENAYYNLSQITTMSYYNNGTTSTLELYFN